MGDFGMIYIYIYISVVKLFRQKWYQTVTVDGVEKPPVEIIKFYNHCHTVMNAQIKGETVVGQGIQKF